MVEVKKKGFAKRVDGNIRPNSAGRSNTWNLMASKVFDEDIGVDCSFKQNKCHISRC